MPNPSIKDVAKKAGVAIGTVSRAFNDYDDIRPETREHILAVANELGYIPNRSARNLSSKTNRDVAVFFFDHEADHEFQSTLSESNPHMVEGAMRYANMLDMELAVYYIPQNKQASRTYEQYCREHSLSGAVLFGLSLEDPWVSILRQTRIPCVTVDLEIDNPMVGSVVTDDEAAFEQVCDYMIGLGHRRIALLYGRIHSMVAQKRWEGAKRSFQKNGISVNPDWIIYTDFLRQTAYEQTRQFIQNHGNEVTAFISMSDLTAFAAIQAIRDEGFRVPEDYSVSGFDGFSVGVYSTPSITSVEQDFVSKGYQAAKLLHDMVSGTAEETRIVVPHKFRPRESTREND
ncbi:MAG: LacI family DNA-binding transcriptional regulator [Oscillospiraceae bacterium]